MQNHKWFRGVDWDVVEAKQIPPPWIPYLRSEEVKLCFNIIKGCLMV